MRRLFLFFVLFALLAGACGGGDDGESVDAETASDDESSGDDASDGDATDDGDDADDVDLPEEGSGSSTDFCETIVALNAETDAFDPFGDGDAIRTFYEETAELSTRLAAIAPGEVEADARLLDQAFQDLRSVLEEYDYDFFAIPEAALEEPPFENPEADAADDRISAFCGLEDDVVPEPVDVTDGSLPDGFTDLIVQQFLDEGFDQQTAECLASTIGDFSSNSELMTPENLADPDFRVCGLTLAEAFG